MERKEFISFDAEKPDVGAWVIVTNNLNAEQKDGRMSHVWLVNFLCYEENPARISSFGDDGSRIDNLTHWKYA